MSVKNLRACTQISQVFLPAGARRSWAVQTLTWRRMQLLLMSPDHPALKSARSDSHRSHETTFPVAHALKDALRGVYHLFVQHACIPSTEPSMEGEAACALLVDADLKLQRDQATVDKSLPRRLCRHPWQVSVRTHGS